MRWSIVAWFMLHEYLQRFSIIEVQQRTLLNAVKLTVHIFYNKIFITFIVKILMSFKFFEIQICSLLNNIIFVIQNVNPTTINLTNGTDA